MVKAQTTDDDAILSPWRGCNVKQSAYNKTVRNFGTLETYHRRAAGRVCYAPNERPASDAAWS
ncbi:hypothetical protein GCM10011611_50630 [Aliidongia dinghuensis]|uniref:Uncharacterized protein n=1 Tax=Aliidongia dinghuensis TaxID=1867774 RepID=A0A8J2YXV8_9PROT|nr:hypothetical protein GCM10011611_50630 [Aliidongia dinghuensis]